MGNLLHSDPEEDEYIVVDPIDGSKVWQRVFRDRHGVKSALMHRVGGPAMITGNGTKIWLHRGLLDRNDGPAREWNNGENEWWIKGDETRTYSDFQRLSGCSDGDILLLKIKYGEMQ